MNRRNLITTGASGALVLLSGGIGRGAADTELTVGQVNLTFYTAAAAVVIEVLERLGHRTRTVDGPHPEIYARLGRGEADLLVASWLPHAHGPLHAPLASELVEAATLYEDALLYWSVPGHVPADIVRAVDDLKRPEVLARMEREIVGVGPGSGLMRGSDAILDRYGLKEHGYTLRVAPPAEWAERLRQATAEGRWIVMPLWRPQYLNAVYPVRPLAEPQGVFGVDRAMLVVRKAIWEGWPARSRAVIGRVSLGIPAVTELERRIVLDGVAPRAAARAWMAENAAAVERWFAA